MIPRAMSRSRVTSCGTGRGLLGLEIESVAVS